MLNIINWLNEHEGHVWIVLIAFVAIWTVPAAMLVVLPLLTVLAFQNAKNTP